ncbi:hypothetical protein DFH28DRAFT_911671 [Melampsora americana]|nr:hypothetical protein DFH28DRAFT_911671 [Melampsora americana]
MSQKGRVIKCPLGPQNKRQRTRRDAVGPSQSIANDLAVVESQSALQNAEELNNALAANQHAIQHNPLDNPNPSRPEHNVPLDSEDNDEPITNLDHQFEPPSSPSEDSEPREPTPPLLEEFVPSFGEYIRGAYYQSKQVLEHLRWKKVIGPMFVAFMTQSIRTAHWGNIQTWNEDFNKDCACGVGALKKRSVDLVDILSRQKKEIVFCQCTSDQVRLIRMGYVGGSPVHPETAFSIRLLRFHHNLWEQCTIRMQGFALALDTFLDVTSPLILVPGTTQASSLLCIFLKSIWPRLWRKTLSSAVDVYRHMILMEDKLGDLALDLSEMDKLASNCPRCFGPFQDNNEQDEPDYIICFDGNFQHRRHKAASNESDKRKPKYPPLFMEPAKVDKWAPRSESTNNSHALVS